MSLVNCLSLLESAAVAVPLMFYFSRLIDSIEFIKKFLNIPAFPIGLNCVEKILWLMTVASVQLVEAGI